MEIRLVFLILLLHVSKIYGSLFYLGDEADLFRNGRFVADKTDEKNRIKYTTECETSDNEKGFCSKLSDCLHFDFSKLQNNVCFMDTFVPGVCCAYEKPNASVTTPPTTIPPKIAAYTPPSTITRNETKRKIGCGETNVPSSRIVRGHMSQPGEWPWMAAIFTNSLIGKQFHCGGSLISKRHVMTGAHCMKDRRGKTFSARQIVVRLGDNDLSTFNDVDNPNAQFYKVEHIQVHPRFKNINQYFLNDVAILKLTRDVEFSSYVSPICLPELERENDPLDVFAGKYTTVIGYGRTENGVPSMKLLNALVPVWKNNDCDDAYFAPITEKFICAGYPAGGIDACQGDSGGPLLLKQNGKWVQVGITSFGRGCGEPGYPGVYTRLSKFVEWIKENLH